MTIEDHLVAHVHELAAEMGVVVIPFGGALSDDCVELPCGASGAVEFADGADGFPIIWVSETPDNARAYLVALHELGHHATHAVTAYVRERLAWDWAMEHSLLVITLPLAAFITDRLETYVD